MTDARQGRDEFGINRMPIALNLAILQQKMLLSTFNSFSSANAIIKTKQKYIVVNSAVNSHDTVKTSYYSEGDLLVSRLPRMQDFRAALITIIQ